MRKKRAKEGGNEVEENRKCEGDTLCGKKCKVQEDQQYSKDDRGCLTSSYLIPSCIRCNPRSAYRNVSTSTHSLTGGCGVGNERILEIRTSASYMTTAVMNPSEKGG